MTEPKTLAEEAAKEIVTKLAPEELPLFAELAQMYWEDPTPPKRSKPLYSDPLGSGFGEELVPLTIAVLALTNTVLVLHIVQQRNDHPAAIINLLGHYQAGLNTLKSRLGTGHPLYSDILIYEHRLTASCLLTQAYGDTEDQRATRNMVVHELNDLTMAELGVSFNDLSSVGKVDWLQMESSQAEQGAIRPFHLTKAEKLQAQLDEGVEQAQKFGVTSTKAKQIALYLLQWLTNYLQDE